MQNIVKVQTFQSAANFMTDKIHCTWSDIHIFVGVHRLALYVLIAPSVVVPHSGPRLDDTIQFLRQFHEVDNCRAHPNYRAHNIKKEQQHYRYATLVLWLLQ